MVLYYHQEYKIEGGELQKKRIIAKFMCVQCAMGHSVAKNVLFWGGGEPGSVHRGEEVSRSLQSW